MKFDYQDDQRSTSKRILSFYAVVMLLVYAGYVVMDYMRLSRGDVFGDLTNLTPTELESAKQLGMWTIGFEVSFALLFLICSIVTVYLYHKNEDFQFIRLFTVLNIGLFLVVGLLGAGVSFIIPIPVGNLIQIVVIPTYFLVALVLYTLYTSRLMRKDKGL